MNSLSITNRFGRLVTRIIDDDVFGRAAQLSYYFLLALFPFLLFLITLLGYLAQQGTEFRSALLSHLTAIMPSSAATLIQTTLDEISASRGGGKLSLGLLVALWAASNGMGAITETLNTAYDVKETRPWWRVRLISILLTVAVSILVVVALAIIFYGGTIGDSVAARYGFSDTFRVIWRIAQWPIGLGFVLITFSMIYNFAPNIPSEERRWSPPGSFVGVALWLTISFLFRLYLHFFDSYSVTYGSLGALIILMLWFYLTGVAILIGGEVNCESDERCERDNNPPALPID